MNRVYERNRNVLMLITIFCVIVLSIFREPLFFAHPRIWAEEGTVYIQAVFNHGVLKSLFMGHLGYYSFFPNFVIGIGLAFVGLEKIAYVTTFFSYVIILLIITAPLLLPSKLWDTNEKKIVLVLFSLTVGSGEIWVNTINSQFYLGLFSCFLLMSETQKIYGWRIYYVLLLIFLAALTGVTTIILLPFFIWKYLREKSRNKLDTAVLLVLFAGLLVQVTALLSIAINSGMSRFDIANIVNFPRGAFIIISSFAPVNIILRPGLFAMAIILAMFREHSFYSGIFPAVLALYISCVFAFLSLGMAGAPRYGYAPAVLVFVFLVNSYPLKTKVLNMVYATFVTLLVVINLGMFFRTGHFYDPNWIRYSPKNAYQNPVGELEIKIFPQWKNVSWVLTLPVNKHENYR